MLSRRTVLPNLCPDLRRRQLPATLRADSPGAGSWVLPFEESEIARGVAGGRFSGRYWHELRAPVGQGRIGACET
jgi:hypothetical protein